MSKFILFQAQECDATQTIAGEKKDIKLLHVGIQKKGSISAFGQTIEGVDIGKGRWAFLPTTDALTKLFVGNTGKEIPVTKEQWNDIYHEDSRTAEEKAKAKGYNL